MARLKYPWDKLTRIGKKFVIDFHDNATDKQKAELERRLRSAASWQQTRNPRVRYHVSIEVDKTTGKRTGVSVERVKVAPEQPIRVE